MAERITNSFIGQEFGWDTMAQVNWGLVRDNVLAARRVLANPEKFPRANFDALERMDMEGTSFLLRAPVQFIV